MTRNLSTRLPRAAVAALPLAFALVCAAPAALAGTTGKISGRVRDARGEPLGGANIAVPTARTGAVSDLDGRFVIINVPAGTHEIKVSLLGYRATTIQGLLVSADQTTTQDIRLEETPLEMPEVVITAERPVVDLNITSNLATVSRQELESLPVQELQDVVNLQAGVVDGHFRGGRIGEVQYQVDGVTMNDPYSNLASVRLDRSLLEEVQVISGTFDAEYGQAMSGVVNAVLRRGGERLQLDAEVYTGAYAFSGGERISENAFDPGGIGNYRASLSGPLGPATTFLASARYAALDNWVTGTRTFVPTDSSDFRNARFYPGGDGETVPLGYTREWSGVAKISNRSLRNTELSYQAVGGRVEARRSDYRYNLNPDGLSNQLTRSLVHGLDVTHTPDARSFVTMALRQNIVDYQDMAFDSLGDPRYDQAGPPLGHPDYGNGAYVQGYELTRFEQFTNALVFKGSYVRQSSHETQLKLGVETQWPTLRFGSPGHLVATGDTIVRHKDEPPDYPGLSEYHPVSAAAYAQEELEWNDLRLRAGLRVEYFDARTSVPSDLQNPANSIDGAPASVPVATTPKVSLSPRLGVSYPVTTDAALFFAYGHFRQMPALGVIFGNADYSILDDLQAGGISYGVLGNPDIEPEETVQYQLGYKQGLTPWLGLDLTIFYKDIRKLLGTEFVTTYNNAEYARLTNVDFGSVSGFTLALDQRRRGLLSTTLDYTWQTARGNSSDPRETATRAEAGLDPRPRQIPFNWDQQHTLNLTLMLSRPGDFSASAIVRTVSGQPYTPTIETGFGGGLETNSGRKPSATVVDVRGEKNWRLGGLGTTLFARVFNLFDTRFFNGFVFGSTGSPYYSRDPGADRVTLADPTRFYGARRVEIGVILAGAEARGSS
jgi:outer membrane receptor protein involved in Fe transport